MGNPQKTLKTLSTQLLCHSIGKQHFRMLTALGRLDFSSPGAGCPVWNTKNIFCRPNLSHKCKKFFPGPLSYCYTQPGQWLTLCKRQYTSLADNEGFLDTLSLWRIPGGGWRVDTWFKTQNSLVRHMWAKNDAERLSAKHTHQRANSWWAGVIAFPRFLRISRLVPDQTTPHMSLSKAMSFSKATTNMRVSLHVFGSTFFSWDKFQ